MKPTTVIIIDICVLIFFMITTIIAFLFAKDVFSTICCFIITILLFIMTVLEIQIYKLNKRIEKIIKKI